MLLTAFCTAMAVFIPCCYFGIRRIAGYHAYIDITVSLALAVAFFGTFSGMVVAAMTGLFLSLSFIAVRTFLGYEKLVHIRRATWRWVSYPPRIDVLGSRQTSDVV